MWFIKLKLSLLKFKLSIFGQWEPLQISFHAIWNNKKFKAHFVYFLPQTWNKPFLQKALISLSGKRYFKTIIWTLGMSIATELAIVSTT